MNTDHEKAMVASDNGLTTGCYDIPEGAKTLDDLIEYKNMSFAMGTIFKVCYAFKERSERNTAASRQREINKIKYYSERLSNRIKS